MKKEKENIRTITCKEAEKSFNDLIDGYLQGKTKTELEQHIAHCQHCFGRIEFENKLKRKIRFSASQAHSITIRKKIVAMLDNE